MRVSVFLFVLLLPTLLHSQIDREELYMMSQNTRDYGFDQLLDFAEEKLESEEDIARFFYYWIGSHIAYDAEVVGVDLGVPVTPEDTDPLNVVKNRKATCLGFTNLYRSFLDYFDIPHRTVLGYSRHRENLLKRAGATPDHAWSAIWLNDQWQLVEPTWANLYMEDRELRDFYFMTDPAEFSMDHLPIDDQWQLMQPKLNLEDFTHRPYIDPRYFELAQDRQMKVELTTNGPEQFILKSSNIFSWRLIPTLVGPNNEVVKRLRFKVNRTKQELEFLLKNYDKAYTLRLDARKTLHDGQTLTMVGIAYLNFEEEGKSTNLLYTTIRKPNRHK